MSHINRICSPNVLRDPLRWTRDIGRVDRRPEAFQPTVSTGAIDPLFDFAKPMSDTRRDAAGRSN